MKLKNNTNPQAEDAELIIRRPVCITSYRIFLLISFIMLVWPVNSTANQCSNKAQAYKKIVKQIKYEKAELEEAKKDYEEFKRKERRQRRNANGGYPGTISITFFGPEQQRYQDLPRSLNANIKKQKQLYSIYKKCANAHNAKLKKKANRKRSINKEKINEIQTRYNKSLEKKSQKNQKGLQQKDMSKDTKQPSQGKKLLLNKDGVWTN